MSIVETNRKQLEVLGDYVTRANINWFAIFPEKLSRCQHTAAENSRVMKLSIGELHFIDDHYLTLKYIEYHNKQICCWQ